MALKGTLKDFGIADILQLIAQQRKTGVLHLRGKQKKEVEIQFQEGTIVSVSTAKKKRRELINEMLVRSELIDEGQLDRALEGQQRTLKRLGDVLVAEKLVTQERFEQIVQLHASETLYELFGWKSGTYEFEQREVELEAGAMKPVRPEAVLLEAFRRLDEWPAIRKVVADSQGVFDKAREALDRDDDQMGASEQTVFGLVDPSRNVQRLIDLSCLGEFETCRALSNLVRRGYIQELEGGKAIQRAPRGLAWAEQIGQNLGRLLVSAMVFAGLLLVVSQIKWPRVGWSTSPTSVVTDHAIERLVSSAQVGRIRAAIEVYQVERGHLPQTLDSLVEANLLRSADLHYPWSEPYYYHRVSNREFVLLPPLR